MQCRWSRARKHGILVERHNLPWSITGYLPHVQQQRPATWQRNNGHALWKEVCLISTREKPHTHTHKKVSSRMSGVCKASEKISTLVNSARLNGGGGFVCRRSILHRSHRGAVTTRQSASPLFIVPEIPRGIRTLEAYGRTLINKKKWHGKRKTGNNIDSQHECLYATKSDEQA